MYCIIYFLVVTFPENIRRPTSGKRPSMGSNNILISLIMMWWLIIIIDKTVATHKHTQFLTIYDDIPDPTPNSESREISCLGGTYRGTVTRHLFYPSKHNGTVLAYLECFGKLYFHLLMNCFYFLKAPKIHVPFPHLELAFPIGSSKHVAPKENYQSSSSVSHIWSCP